MTLNLFCSIICAIGIAFGGYVLGKRAGREHGYRQCLGEQDDDRPIYARGPK
jgi:hypothetical protein